MTFYSDFRPFINARMMSKNDEKMMKKSRSPMLPVVYTISSVVLDDHILPKKSSSINLSGKKKRD